MILKLVKKRKIFNNQVKLMYRRKQKINLDKAYRQLVRLQVKI